MMVPSKISHKLQINRDLCKFNFWQNAVDCTFIVKILRNFSCTFSLIIFVKESSYLNGLVIFLINYFIYFLINNEFSI